MKSKVKTIIVSIVLKGVLKCGNCSHSWSVRELILDRKAVQCSVCGRLNDINQAMKNSNVVPEIVREKITSVLARKEEK